jgi:hypothetical protein
VWGTLRAGCIPCSRHTNLLISGPLSRFSIPLESNSPTSTTAQTQRSRTENCRWDDSLDILYHFTDELSGTLAPNILSDTNGVRTGQRQTVWKSPTIVYQPSIVPGLTLRAEYRPDESNKSSSEGVETPLGLAFSRTRHGGMGGHLRQRRNGTSFSATTSSYEGSATPCCPRFLFPPRVMLASSATAPTIRKDTVRCQCM